MLPFNYLNLLFKLTLPPAAVSMLLITVNISIYRAAKRDRVSVSADYSEHMQDSELILRVI